MNRFRQAVRASAALIGLACTVARPATAQNSYTVTDLGAIPQQGFFAAAYGINAAGAIVGWAYVATPADFGVIESPMAATWDIAGNPTTPFAAAYPAPAFGTNLTGINTAGMMIGSITEYNTYITQLTLFTPTGMTPLVSPGQGGDLLTINAGGQTSGDYIFTDPLGQNHKVACVWMPDGTRTDITSPTEFGVTTQINDAGKAVGFTYLANGSGELPFTWTASGGRQPLFFNGSDAVAYAINNAGTIGGRVDGHATLWVNGVQQIIPTLGDSSEVFKLFDNGAALTTIRFKTASGGDTRNVAFDCLYDGVQNRTLISMLPQSNLRSVVGYGINQLGQIVGTAAGHGVLLTPSDTVLPHPTDVTAHVSATVQKPRYDRATKKWTVVVTVSNTGNSDIVGPIYVVPRLTARALVAGYPLPFDGVISMGSQTGSPFWELQPVGNGHLAPEASASLSFTLSVVDLRTYNDFTIANVFAGPGRP